MFVSSHCELWFVFSAEECGVVPFMCCEAYFGWAEKLEMLGGRSWDLPCGCGLQHCQVRKLQNSMQARLMGADVFFFLRVIYTPPKTKMITEKQPFEDVSPTKNGDFPLSC